MAADINTAATPPTVAGLFAGIGGIELGLERAGFKSVLLCEKDPLALQVLQRRFSKSQPQFFPDVSTLTTLPRNLALLTAGFPCQDLSQVGQTQGIEGPKSSLVRHVFELLKSAEGCGPEWVLLENVPFMLSLHRGLAIRQIIDRLENLGYRWAYRVIEARAFGLPQRRQRVYVLASRRHDPRGALLNSEAQPPAIADENTVACGFYWTEGNRGLGWAIDAVPTLKSGSGLSIPSPPAIRLPCGTIVVPSITVAERLMGFPKGWTLPAEHGGKPRDARSRWRLVGNAVSVPVALWLGRQIQKAPTYKRELDDEPLQSDQVWPKAAWGGPNGKRFCSRASIWPVTRKAHHLLEFLENDYTPLSYRAAKGFRDRYEKSSLRRRSDLLDRLNDHVKRYGPDPANPEKSA